MAAASTSIPNPKRSPKSNRHKAFIEVQPSGLVKQRIH
jgi:hypothetical protein